MKSTLLSLLFLATLLLTPTTIYGAAPTQQATSELTPSITVLGYGTASAIPDSVHVDLFIGEQPTYGPGGPEMSFFEPADLEFVREYLIEEGVDVDTIRINFLSRNFAYGPSSFAGEVAFSYSELDHLRTLLQDLLDEMKSSRGPSIQGANIVFRLEDCPSLEQEAMRAALDDARQRATRMAELLEMTLGSVISVSEDVSPVGAVRPAGGCIAHVGQTSPGGYNFIGGPSSLANTPSDVEVGIMVKVTFALEK